MRSAVRASVRRNAAGIRAQSPDNVDEAVVEGGKLYLNGCAGCHGDSRKTRRGSQQLSSRAPVAAGRHAILTTRNVLDHQTWHQEYGHVRLRPVLFRQGTLGAYRFPPTNRPSESGRHRAHSGEAGGQRDRQLTSTVSQCAGPDAACGDARILYVLNVYTSEV